MDWFKGCGKDGGDWGKGKDWGKGWGMDFGGKDWGKKGGGMILLPGMKGKMGGPYGKGGAAPGGYTHKPGEYYEEPGGHVGIEGLKDAVTRATQPHVATEKGWSHTDMINKMCLCMLKTASKWWKDDARHKESGTAIQAQALLEEYAEKIMGALSSTCHDKPWFLEIYLSEAVALCAIYTFKGGPMFKRTVAPIIVTHVDEAIFRYREEERHQRVMWDAVSSVGIKADYHKKANKHLQTSFEAAHISAKYGTSPAITPELGMVQDFVQAWLGEFGRRGWDVMNNGIHSPTQDQQVQVMTALFQYLCDPAHSCLPHDLIQQMPTPPPAGWDFVAQAVILWFSQQ